MKTKMKRQDTTDLCGVSSVDIVVHATPYETRAWEARHASAEIDARP